MNTDDVDPVGAVFLYQVSLTRLSKAIKLVRETEDLPDRLQEVFVEFIRNIVIYRDVLFKLSKKSIGNLKDFIGFFKGIDIEAFIYNIKDLEAETSKNLAHAKLNTVAHERLKARNDDLAMKLVEMYAVAEKEHSNACTEEMKAQENANLHVEPINRGISVRRSSAAFGLIVSMVAGPPTLVLSAAVSSIAHCYVQYHKGERVRYEERVQEKCRVQGEANDIMSSICGTFGKSIDEFGSCIFSISQYMNITYEKVKRLQENLASGIDTNQTHLEFVELFEKTMRRAAQLEEWCDSFFLCSNKFEIELERIEDKANLSNICIEKWISEEAMCLNIEREYLKD